MKKRLLVPFAGVAALIVLAAAHSSPFAQGARTMMLAHNAYPDEGKYGDRLDRATSAGGPFVVEEDLVWVEGKSKVRRTLIGTRSFQGLPDDGR